MEMLIAAGTAAVVLATGYRFLQREYELQKMHGTAVYFLEGDSNGKHSYEVLVRVGVIFWWPNKDMYEEASNMNIRKMFPATL
jgi:hypothetical protein